ncbi:hypothetical protein MKX01_021234 [Papaver californicum]|nr:hypothetical protein MKX01_021234 [Papaver californicum]
MEDKRNLSESERLTFALPVDSDNKATQFKILSLAKPHMRAFHLSWISFFACFVSTFAAPPLLPIIRDNLNLTATDIGNAGIASVSGAVFARLVMGTACDLWGPRLASSALILLTSPAVYFTATINSPISFLLVRFFTGFSLSTFVSTQFWMSTMFSAKVVGTANGVAAGWGNLGGGATQLLMPLVYELIRKMGSTNFTAWRVAFFIPALFQTITAYMVFFFGQDLPAGNFRRLQNSGEKAKDKMSEIFYHGIKNYRGWILALGYGYSFGVELTVDNIIAEYFFDRFNLKLHTAGLIAASFGLANFVSRPGGGMFSDFMAKRYGMRGRIWSLWLVQTAGGVLCVVLGRVGSLGPSITVMLIFSSLGLISGMTGAGGNVGAVLTQVIFFKGAQYSKETGITLMGIMIICCTLPIPLIYFPAWGGMFFGPSTAENTTEEEYYASEWNSREKEEGKHLGSLKFAETSKSERGRKIASQLRPTSGTSPTTVWQLPLYRTICFNST